MMKYVIYHVYGKKIGLTENYPTRVRKQGLQNYPYGIEDQVSEGCGPKFAHEVEKFWQQYYGLKVDQVSYQISIENSGYKKFTPEERRKYGAMADTASQIKNKVGIFGYTKEEKYLVGKSGADALTTEQRAFAGRARAKKTNSIVAKCEVCGFESTPAGVGLHKRWKCLSNSPVISEG